jgi:hypothetical protein
MLIHNIAEVRKYLQATAAFKFEQVEMHLLKAQLGELTQIFGSNLITAMDTRWNNGAPSPALSAKESQLIALLQAAMANFGYVKALPFLSVQNTSAGVAQAETPQNKPLFKWQKMELQDEALENAWQAVESAVVFLIANRDDFSTWKNSIYEAAQLANFINLGSEFNISYGIANSRRTFEAIKSSMREAENLFIKPTIGRTLFNSIKAEIAARNISTQTAAFLPLIKDAVANYAISIAIWKLELRFDENGARVVSNASTGGNDTSRIKSAADLATKTQIAEKCQQTGNSYLGELLQYLRDNNLIEVPSNSTIDNSTGAFVL